MKVGFVVQAGGVNILICYFMFHVQVCNTTNTLRRMRHSYTRIYCFLGIKSCILGPWALATRPSLVDQELHIGALDTSDFFVDQKLRIGAVYTGDYTISWGSKAAYRGPGH